MYLSSLYKQHSFIHLYSSFLFYTFKSIYALKANPSQCITPNNDIDNSKTPFQNFIAINTTGLNRVSSAQTAF